jgi:Zn-dependent protease with chaperone function
MTGPGAGALDNLWTMIEAIDDWELPTEDRIRHRASALGVVLLALAGGIGAGAAAVAGSPLPAGAAAGIALGMLWIASRGRAALRSAGARRIPADAEPRLASLVAGLSSDLGIGAPSLWLYKEGGPNALVCSAGGGAIAVSESAVTRLNRTELEALVAHCLIRLQTRSTRAAAVASAARPFASALGPVVTGLDDARAAALTRYPPAVVNVLKKSHPHSGRFGAFYFHAKGPAHERLEARIEAVSDL